ncbi:extracellular solute-binding protein [Corynebacterium mendelii]|uniref:Extracellular solute-binding protein n=1 Tax=Corynebacterium mendelii TaxID=2765362 RepID=A0A939DZS6_9CORY|nr:extracellular solute-binding protein [Corynebacterium mendelii]MBN9643845.1 extracellular solute-binding protein [Corynebacterium mendelii]
MKKLLAALSGAALTVSLAACGGGASDDAAAPAESPADKTAEASADGELVIWGDETRGDVVKALGDIFEKETGVHVKFVQKSNDNISDDWTKQVAAGQGPDLIVTAHDHLGGWVKDGVVGTIDFSMKKDKFLPVAVQGVTYNGQTYGVPYAIENVALVRNNALTQAEPATFDEMIEAGQQSGAKYPLIVQSDPTNGDPYHMYAFQTSFGAPVFKSTDEGYTDELGMGGPEGQAFAGWLAEQGAAGQFDVNITGDKAKQEFGNGEAAFTITGPWNIPSFKDKGLDISVLPIPSAGGETASPFVGVQAFFPNPKSKNPLIVNKFLTDVVASENGQIAAYKAGERSPAWVSAAEQVDDPIVKGFTEAGGNGAPMPAIPAMNAVWQFWGSTEANITQGKQQPQEGWDAMIGNVEKAIADN